MTWMATTKQSSSDWPARVYERLRQSGVTQVGYVPDAGHATLIAMAINDAEVTATMCTTEEESIAIATGAWLGGMRSAVLMQSSGVGNCINMLSLPVQTRTPLLMLVTMRGEWAEFNPWQVPMGQATQPALEAIGVQTVRVADPDAVEAAVAQAAMMAFEADQQVAVLISQKLLGAKQW